MSGYPYAMWLPSAIGVAIVLLIAVYSVLGLIDWLDDRMNR